MKRTLITLLFALTCTGQALAWDNICSVAGPAVNYTTIQVDNFADKYTQRSFEGAGVIRDVKSGGLASKFTIIIDCGNNVLIEVPTSSPRASSGLQIGESISFSGKLNSLRRKRYVNTHDWYLLVGLNDNSSIW